MADYVWKGVSAEQIEDTIKRGRDARKALKKRREEDEKRAREDKKARKQLRREIALGFAVKAVSPDPVEEAQRIYNYLYDT